MSDNLYSLNIERAILSSIIYSPDIYEEVASKLESQDFYLEVHSSIFKEMGDISKKGDMIDEDILKRRLSSRDFKEDILIDILATNPVGNIEAYIEEIKERAIKRAIKRLSLDIQKLIEEDHNSSFIVDEIHQEIYKISADLSTKDFKDSKEIVEATLDGLTEAKKRNNSSIIGLDTGFRGLNIKTLGFNKGDLIVIAARPSMGKTSLALNMALKTLESGGGVAIFSLEMSAEQMALRMLSSKTYIPFQSLRLGNLTDEQWQNLSKEIDEMSKRKLFISDKSFITIHEIRAKLRKLKVQNPDISLGIVDYLQLMNSSSSKDRHLEVAEISRGLKLLARELDMPIIALSQLNRSLESRADKRPMLSDIRESGAIEQDADLILFIYREDVYKARDEKEKQAQAMRIGKRYKSSFVETPEESAEVIIGKHRNGPTGIVKLVFHKPFTRFQDAVMNITYEDSDIPFNKDQDIDIE